MAIFWDLQPLWSSSITKPDLLRFRSSSGHVLSKTKSVTPHFCFTFLTSLTHHLSIVKFSEKKSMLEKFRANVLKGQNLAIEFASLNIAWTARYKSQLFHLGRVVELRTRNVLSKIVAAKPPGFAADSRQISVAHGPA